MDDFGVNLVKFGRVEVASVSWEPVSQLVEDQAFVSGLKELVLQPPAGSGKLLEDINTDFRGLDKRVDLGLKRERLVKNDAEDFHRRAFGKRERNVQEPDAVWGG